MLTTIIAAASGLLVGAIAALTVIAPKTKTKADDEVLAILQRIEGFVTSANQAK